MAVLNVHGAWLGRSAMLIGLLFVATKAGTAEELVVREEALPVVIKGKSLSLETLIVRRMGSEKLPIALITHGSPGYQRDKRETRATGFMQQARELAHRGWLSLVVIRRGFGKSEGEAIETGPCAGIDFRPYFAAQADDLEAALKAVAQRPDVDAGRSIAIGVSAGGPSVIELANRAAAKLSAAINISGGISTGNVPFEPGSGCATAESELVWTMARLGRTVRTPTLWVYAENDLYFRPSLVARMHTAFTGAGGAAELVTFPPIGSDGHSIFNASEGRRQWLPVLDRFIRAANLPTWEEGAFNDMLANAKPQTRSTLIGYLRTGPVEKALAAPADGTDGGYWWGGVAQLADARKRALEECRKAYNRECKIIAENFDLIK